MIKRLAGFSILIVSLSCNSEKLSLSPVYNSGTVSLPNAGELPKSLKDQNSEVFYASELTNQISTFPTFSNTAINSEVGELKYHVKNYVYAIQGYNLVGRKEALAKIEKSYKKLQKLRKYLNTDEDETINRYLVRIKSNISQLEVINAKTRPEGNS